MARPTRCRRICQEPVYDCFVPDSGPAGGDTLLTLDEYETIRLIDLEKLTHAQCAQQMEVSRTTVTELYESARYKLADSLVHGRRLRIVGGHYRLCGGAQPCCGGRCFKSGAQAAPPPAGQKGIEMMKIAVTYQDGEIFQHFGHTGQFKLYTVADGRITAEQVVDTNGAGHGALAGFLLAAGVDTLICGGIGMGAQNALGQAGIRLYGGVQGRADDAVRALLAGSLGYDPEVHCDHHGHGGEGHTCGSGGCHSHEDAAHTCGGHGCHHEAE